MSHHNTTGTGTVEQKFERVEEHTLDKKTGNEEIRVASDTGKGDPGLNFTPTDPALVKTPGGAVGVAPVVPRP